MNSISQVVALGLFYMLVSDKRVKRERRYQGCTNLSHGDIFSMDVHVLKYVLK